MKIQQIRSAMVRIEYAGKTFLTDPWLAEKGSMETFSDTSFRYRNPAQATISMPMCDLPIPVEEILIIFVYKGERLLFLCLLFLYSLCQSCL